MNKQKVYPWLMLAACCSLSAATMGIVSSAMPVFYAPTAQGLNTGVGTISLYATLLSLTTGLFGPILVTLLKKFNIKAIVAAGGLICGLAIFSMSFFSTPFMFYVAGIIAGIGYACCASITINTVLVNWFHNKLSTVTGIAFSFSGAAGAVMSPIFASIISAAGWRAAYMVTGILIIILTVPIGLFIIAKRPEDLRLKPFGYREFDEDLIALSKFRNAGMKHGTLLMILFSICGAIVVNFGSHVSAYMTSLNFDPSAAASVLSISMISNVITKLLMGALAEKMGTFKAIQLYAIFPIVGLFCFLLIPTGSSMLRYLAPACFGVTYAITSVGISIAAREFVPDDKYDSIYANATLIMFVVGAVMISVYGTLFDIFGSYTVSIIFGLVFAILMFAIILYVNLRYKSLKIEEISD